MAKNKTQNNATSENAASENAASKVVTLEYTDEDRAFGEYLDRLAERQSMDTGTPTKAKKKPRAAASTRKDSALVSKPANRRTSDEKLHNRARLDESEGQEPSFHDLLQQASEAWEDLLSDDSYLLLILAFADDLAGERLRLANMMKAFKKMDATLAKAQDYQQTHGSLVGFEDSQNMASAKGEGKSHKAKKSKARAKGTSLEVQADQKKSSTQLRVSKAK